MIVLNKPYVTIERDDEMKCLIQTWKGFAKSNEFRAAINDSLAFFVKGGIDKIISDTKEFSLVKKEDTDWVAQVITPQMVQHGLRYMAFVVPKNVFTKISVDNFKEGANSVVSIRYFDEVALAKQWLTEAESEKKEASEA